MNFPVDMEYIGKYERAKGMVIRFTGYSVGKVISLNGVSGTDYYIGYESNTFIRCDDKKSWREVYKIQLDDSLFEI